MAASSKTSYLVPMLAIGGAAVVGAYYVQQQQQQQQSSTADSAGIPKKAPSKKMKSKTDLWDKGKGLHGARSKSFNKTVGFYDNPEHTKNKPDKTVWDMKVQSDKARQPNTPNPAPTMGGGGSGAA
ncbi:hypothetical protein PPROV_000181600 [Pycnococcus provasolii]|uniref:Uncharacterized protein n=2 Tax=Chlorophyta TaxID=3041 RepID=A0A830HBU6_9CHLO|nr:hypothetical protein PPROV_000181600 [Pycnococcus provasolii]|mmetsp:Transcript_13126/g.34924  ORF Transcript_13126/g.34924 Transcript_13126/m.34924 type:complete len:126 (-) Transcript_13126:117-494(-)